MVIYLNFLPLEVASSYRDRQLQVGGGGNTVEFEIKYLHIFIFRHTFYFQ